MHVKSTTAQTADHQSTAGAIASNQPDPATSACVVSTPNLPTGRMQSVGRGQKRCAGASMGRGLSAGTLSGQRRQAAATWCGKTLGSIGVPHAAKQQSVGSRSRSVDRRASTCAANSSELMPTSSLPHHPRHRADLQLTKSANLLFPVAHCTCRGWVLRHSEIRSAIQLGDEHSWGSICARSTPPYPGKNLCCMRAGC